jgi:hypothetical protein
MKEMLILKVDGTTETIRTEKPPTLDQLQEAVGGYIQIVPDWPRWTSKPCEVYCDENGLLKEKPLNRQATLAWRAQLKGAYDPDMARLWGDVVIVTSVKE